MSSLSLGYGEDQEAVRASARAIALIQRQGALIALIVLALGGWLRYGANFVSPYNIFDAFLNSNSYYALIALGMAFVIMSGGIDLSVGSVTAMSAVTAAQLSGYGLVPAAAGAIGIGLATGIVNGVLIGQFKLQSFVITLATLLAGRGMALVLSNNAPVMVDFSAGFPSLGTTRVGPVPLPVVIVAVLYLLGAILLRFTRFGRHVLAIGGNEEAARLAGVPIERTLLIVYAMSGALAGLAGALLAALSYSGSPTSAVGWELSAIAAVVVGGTLLTGGVGSVGGTLVGVLLLGLIFNALNFEQAQGVFQLNVFWENLIRGVFLLIVVVFQSRLARRLGAGAT
ncbi:MAG: ABC transporter permease [Thermomicrobiales bacterium]|nr:ABC transporter permease [Thermomicrobiales bacterium]